MRSVNESYLVKIPQEGPARPIQPLPRIQPATPMRRSSPKKPGPPVPVNANKPGGPRYQLPRVSDSADDSRNLPVNTAKPGGPRNQAPAAANNPTDRKKPIRQIEHTTVNTNKLGGPRRPARRRNSRRRPRVHRGNKMSTKNRAADS